MQSRMFDSSLKFALLSSQNKDRTLKDKISLYMYINNGISLNSSERIRLAVRIFVAVLRCILAIKKMSEF
jgi:hypothetical protein